MKERKTIVIKLGTSTLTQGSKHLNKAHMLEIVRAIAKLKQDDHRVLVVSSGAVAAGREILHDPKLPPLLSSKQMLASVGQGKLMELYENLFSIYDIHIGQILLTRADLESRERYLNARDTLFALLDNDIIPIVNENDAVSTQEIKVGDNDTMAALIGMLSNADLVILLTDQKGLYTKDPRKNPDATLISEVKEIDESIFALAGGTSTGLGTGGMLTKVKAANIATKAGITLVVALGDNPDILHSLVDGSGEGTYFRAKRNAMQAKKLWLEAATKAVGSITIDTGAKQALLHEGSSLLPSGVISFTGNFSRGSVISILDTDNNKLALGMCRYGSDEIALIAGHKSADIEKLLGYSHGTVVVHRDDLTLC